jgi:hypothetical protein
VHEEPYRQLELAVDGVLRLDVVLVALYERVGEPRDVAVAVAVQNSLSREV